MSGTDGSGISRRQLLAGAATATAATAGCTRRVRSILGRSGSDQVSLSIASVPADVDDASIRIARHLRSNLDAVGISTTIDYYSFEEFWLEFLVNQSFDIAVGPHPGGSDPDVLYEMFHSTFSPESGWQNPYGFTDIELDSLLERQRTETAPERAETVGRILERIAREQPLVPLCVPANNRLVRPERVSGSGNRTFDHGSDILSLTFDPEGPGPSGPGNGTGGSSARTGEDELTLAIRYTTPTENLNPLAVEYRKSDAVTGLLYDSLAVTEDDEDRPWLADTVEWSDGTAEITLRDETWHDGQSVTAGDVAFTYQLLSDTSLGELESPIPTSRFRGLADLVSEVDVHDQHHLTLSVAGSEAVAWRALTVPILPEHVWIDRTDLAEAGGVVSNGRATEAVVVDNIPPIGSGPYEYVDRSERNDLVLERRPDHFAMTADSLDDLRPPAPRIEIVVAPSDAAANEWIQDGDVDITLSPLWHETVDRTDDSLVLESPTTEFYHLGYNVRNDPLSNSLFRRLVSSLVDKSWIVEEVFGGTARPIATPMTDETWIPSSLAWDGDRDPELPFLGRDGYPDADAARDRLVEMGYQYNEDGDLIAVGED